MMLQWSRLETPRREIEGSHNAGSDQTNPARNGAIRGIRLARRERTRPAAWLGELRANSHRDSHIEPGPGVISLGGRRRNRIRNRAVPCPDFNRSDRSV